MHSHTLRPQSSSLSELSSNGGGSSSSGAGMVAVVCAVVVRMAALLFAAAFVATRSVGAGDGGVLVGAAVVLSPQNCLR